MSPHTHIAQPVQPTDPWWWLSFVQPDPRHFQEHFLGVAIVQAATIYGAVPEAHTRGCNPGGEVQIRELPPSVIEKVPDSFRNRLLSREDLDELKEITLSTG